MWYMMPMNDVHLGTFDLNLLLALDALLTERSVTRASARIGITQSAAPTKTFATSRSGAGPRRQR
jgi:hypothetical protein